MSAAPHDPGFTQPQHGAPTLRPVGPDIEIIGRVRAIAAIEAALYASASADRSMTNTSSWDPIGGVLERQSALHRPAAVGINLVELSRPGSDPVGLVLTHHVEDPHRRLDQQCSHLGVDGFHGLGADHLPGLIALPPDHGMHNSSMSSADSQSSLRTNPGWRSRKVLQPRPPARSTAAAHHPGPEN